MRRAKMAYVTALDEYLTLHGQGADGNVWSCFAAALHDARKASGRNEDTAEVVDPASQGNWLGAIGYLCMFDQLGTTVRLISPGAALAARMAAVPGHPGGAEAAFRSTLY